MPLRTKFALLTDNEKSEIVAAERRRRRLVRLIQVRQQCNENGRALREKVQSHKESELRAIKQQLKESVAAEKRAKLADLHEEMDRSLVQLGAGHCEAKRSPNALHLRAKRMAENRARAKERYRQAAAKQRTQNSEVQLEKVRANERRRVAVETAKARCRAARRRTPVRTRVLNTEPVNNVLLYD